MTKTKDTSKAAKTKKTRTAHPSGNKAAAVYSMKKTTAKKSASTKSKPATKSLKTVRAIKTPEKKLTIKVNETKPVQKKKEKLSPRDQKLHQMKLTLLRQRAALLDEAESALNELPDQTAFPDLGDQATAETDRNFMLRLRGREQRLLKKIDEAIERIDTGTFGICDDCGNEIDIKRLEARPVTTMCIECKTLQEEEEKIRES